MECVLKLRTAAQWAFPFHSGGCRIELLSTCGRGEEEKKERNFTARKAWTKLTDSQKIHTCRIYLLFKYCRNSSFHRFSFTAVSCGELTSKIAFHDGNALCHNTEKRHFEKERTLTVHSEILKTWQTRRGSSSAAHARLKGRFWKEHFTRLSSQAKKRP